jgi:hypothetical protein
MGNDKSTTTTATSSSQASTLTPLEHRLPGPRERRESKAPTSYLVLKHGRNEIIKRLAESTTSFTLSKEPAGWDLVQKCNKSTGTKESTLYADVVKKIVGGGEFTDVSGAETVECELVGDKWKVVRMTPSKQPESSATSAISKDV